MPAKSMTLETVRTIRERWAKGAKYPELTREFGIGRGTLWALLRRKTYQEEPTVALRRRREESDIPTLAEIEAWSEPEPNSGCWIWLRSRDLKGYGHICVLGGVERAHRVAYIAAGGMIRRGRQVLHRCDNPPCVNPAHLFTGTNDDNVRDRCAKGRSSRSASPGSFGRGEQHVQHKLSWADVHEIRRRYVDGGCTMRSLGAEYNVNHNTIRALLIGRSWKEEPA